MRKKHWAVIDSNVVYAGLYSSAGASHQILRLIEEGRVVPYLSTALLYEYEEILRRNQKRLRLTVKDIEDVLDGLCCCGEECQIHFLWRPQLGDPKDDHVLELAVAANCADIITFNTRDFRGASRFGVRIVQPGQLLEELSWAH